MKIQRLPQNSRQRIIAQISRGIVLGIACFLVVTVIASWGTLSLAQQSGSRSTRISSVGDIEYASISLDGTSLFQVATQDVSPSESEPSGSLSPIERRVQRIERNLYNIVNLGFDPQELEVKPATLNNLTVIVATDDKKLSRVVIVTLTETDALIASSSVADLAEQWSQIIRSALIRAWQARQPEARQYQITTVAKIILGIIIISFLLLWGQKILKNSFKTLTKRIKQQKQSLTSLKSPSQPLFDQAHRFFSEPLGVLSAFDKKVDLRQQITLNLLLQRLLQIGLIFLWLSGVAAILYVFPETRPEGRGLFVIPLKIFIIWFVLTLISNLAILYVNYKLKEWVDEESVISQDSQRAILRAPTLLEVSEGIIDFTAWCIGIVWFLVWIEVFPNSLLTGAGIVGAALTFAFQNLLKDWINGILIIFEDQYAVGDMIEFGGLIGIVDNMSLRATQIRGLDGRIITIPHNQMLVAHNLTNDWSRANLTIEVAYDSDPTVVITLMKQVAQEMAGDLQWQDDIINPDPSNLMGVSRVTHSGLEIMMWIQVKRLRQFEVEREFRRRLKLAFDEKGIKIGVPKQSLLFQENRGQN